MLFLGLLFGVTDNNDWGTYTYIFEGEIESNDFLFSVLSKYLFAKGYDFLFLYQIHIVIMAVFFVYFASRFGKSSTFIIICIYSILQFVPLSNQIRFFVAYSFFLFATYELMVGKNKILFAVFALMSFMSHFGILLMFPFILAFYKYGIANYIKRVMLWGIYFTIIVFVSYNIIITLLPQYIYYFSPEMTSTFLGGVFNNLIWILWFLLILRTHSKIMRESPNEINEDLKYNYLFKLSLYSIIFLPISFYLQIFSHRYIASAIIVWVAYLIYVNNYKATFYERIKSFSILIILFSVTFIYIYILPEYVIGISGYDTALETISSNSLFSIFF